MLPDVKLDDFEVRIEGEDVVIMAENVIIATLPGTSTWMPDYLPDAKGNLKGGSVQNLDVVAEIRILRLLVATIISYLVKKGAWHID